MQNKPLISYYGGKQRLASKIVKYLPKHTVYVEPFAGGLAVLFAKPWPDINCCDYYREVINDLDELLINFYRMVKDNCDELIDKIQLTLYARKEHEYAIQICKNPADYTNLEKAWAYYVNINMSFSNIISTSWGTNVCSVNAANTWLSKRINFPDGIKRLTSVFIECDDAIKVIERWDSPQTLFYCDPPYINSNQGYTHKYSIEQYKELITILNNIQGSFVLSGYNNDYVKELKFDSKVVFKTKMSAANGKTRKQIETKREDCIWIRDRSDNVRDEIKKLFSSGKYYCFKYCKPSNSNM